MPAVVSGDVAFADDADWTPPPNPDRPLPVQWKPRLHDGGSAVMTSQCMKCDWSFTGPATESMAQHLAHRTEHHPKLATTSTRTKGQRRKSQSIKQAVGEREARKTENLAKMVAALEEGPCSAAQLAAACGLTIAAATTLLAWARKHGETTAVFNLSVPGYERGAWSLGPLPLGPGISDVIKALRSGPKTAQELAEVVGGSPVSAGTMVGHAVKKGELAAHQERLDGKKRWILDEPEVESGK